MSDDPMARVLCDLPNGAEVRISLVGWVHKRGREVILKAPNGDEHTLVDFMGRAVGLPVEIIAEDGGIKRKRGKHEQ